MNPRRKQPVIQRYQVEVRAGRFYVVDTDRNVVAGGPFKTRAAAQNRADEMERRSG